MGKLQGKFLVIACDFIKKLCCFAFFFQQFVHGA
jgi:hypothetical protein